MTPVTPVQAPRRLTAVRVRPAYTPTVRPGYYPGVVRQQLGRIVDDILRLPAAAARWWRWSSNHRNTPSSRYRHILAELSRPHRTRRPPSWNAPTVANPHIGRAGMLTPAQTWRANGGRWNGNRPHGVRW